MVYTFTGFPDMTSIDGAYDYHLPQVKCQCSLNSSGDGYFAFPALEFDAQDPMFSDENCALSPEELNVVRARILKKVGRRVWLPPGASLGPFSGTSHTSKLTDFVDPSYLLISKRALEKLDGAGVSLRTGPAHIRCRGKMLDSHLALQVEPIAEPVLAASTVEALTLEYCAICGDCHKVDPRRKLKPGECQLRKEVVPSEATVFKLYEWSLTLVTQRFTEVATELGLSGAKFKPWGTLV